MKHTYLPGIKVLLGWLLLIGAVFEAVYAVMMRQATGFPGHWLAAAVFGIAGFLNMPWVGTNLRAVLGLIFLAVVTAVLVFVPAGTLDYWQGWTYLAISITSSCLTVFYLMKHDPALLQRRLHSGAMAERYFLQRVIMLFVSGGFVALIVGSVLDHRNGWSAVPGYAVIAGDILLVIGHYVVFRVFKENTFAAATIQIEEGQRVISTGPYAKIRHPMYGGAVAMYVGTPIALGSYAGLLVSLALIAVLVCRLLHEEKLLAKNLSGYADYQQRVRWRLIPGLF